MELAKVFVLFLLGCQQVCNGINLNANSTDKEHLADLLLWEEASDLLKGLLGEELVNGGLISQETNSSSEVPSSLPANFSLHESGSDANYSQYAGVVESISNPFANFSLDESGSDANYSQGAGAVESISSAARLVILPAKESELNEESSAGNSSESKPSLLIVYGNFTYNGTLEAFVNGFESIRFDLP